jgi:acyl carrier protein
MPDDLYPRLTPIFEDVFDEDDMEVSPTLTANEVEGWDSLSHIRLIIAIEKEFGIRFRTTEVNSFRDVGELVELLKGKLAA